MSRSYKRKKENVAIEWYDPAHSFHLEWNAMSEKAQRVERALFHSCNHSSYYGAKGSMKEVTRSTRRAIEHTQLQRIYRLADYCDADVNPDWEWGMKRLWWVYM